MTEAAKGEILSLAAVGLHVLLKFTLPFYFSFVSQWSRSPLLPAVSAKWIFRKWMFGRRGRLTALPEANDFIVEHQGRRCVHPDVCSSSARRLIALH